jgi:hypothetical protein
MAARKAWRTEEADTAGLPPIHVTQRLQRAGVGEVAQSGIQAQFLDLAA